MKWWYQHRGTRVGCGGGVGSWGEAPGVVREAGDGSVGGCGRAVAKSGGVEIPGGGDESCGGATRCC